MDGRAHTQDVNPIWFGESIGKWDGDDLVIDTIGFNDKFWFDLPATRTRSNCTRSNDTGALFGHLEWQTYIDDPGAYTKPFTVYGRVNLLPKEELMEYICQENNRDVGHIVGKDPRNRESQH